ncbi:MAG TPA: hypothetical protein VKR32_00780 [Puia sp.]|nr:hypothetical protein [Puia sp.]
MKKSFIKYSKTSSIVLIIETLYLYACHLFPHARNRIFGLHLANAIGFVAGIIFILCVMNLFLLMAISIYFLRSRATMKFSALIWMCSLAFYLAAGWAFQSQIE